MILKIILPIICVSFITFYFNASPADSQKDIFETISWLEIFKATVITAVVGLSGYMAFYTKSKNKTIKNKNRSYKWA